MRLTQLTRISLGAMVVLVIAASAAGYFGLRFAGQLASYYPQKLLPGTILAKNVSANFQAYLLSVVDPDINEDQVAIRKAINADLESLRKMVFEGSEPPEPDAAKGVTTLLEAWKEMDSIAVTDPEVAAKMNVAFKKAEPAMKRLDVIVTGLANAGSAKIQGAIAMVTNVLLIGGLIAVVLGIAISIMLGRAVNRPLNDLQATMRRIEETNDLTARADDSRKDEFGLIAHSFNGMVGRLQQLVSQVSSATHSVNDLAENLISSADSLRNSAANQSEAVSANAAATEELTVSIATVSDTAQDVRSRSKQSVANTNQGNRKVGELVDEITVIQKSVNQITSAVEDFVRSTGAITGLTREVREIADQTNLLALNAAIEAARAGEQGRGFAVVADEVRKLAEKSGSSAGEIDAVAKSIVAQSDAVRLAIDAGMKAIEASSKLATDVEEKINQARESVEESGNGINEIAGAVAEQKIASTEIAQNMERIALGAEDAAETASNMNSSAAELHQAANALKAAISGFRI